MHGRSKWLRFGLSFLGLALVAASCGSGDSISNLQSEEPTLASELAPTPDPLPAETTAPVAAPTGPILTAGDIYATDTVVWFWAEW